MISPYRYNWKNFVRFAIAGILVICIFVGVVSAMKQVSLVETLSDRTIQFAIVVIYQFALALGLFVALTNRQIFHRKVINPISTRNLVRGHIYWFNGETHAQYRNTNGKDQYGFKVYGLDNFNSRPYHITYFTSEEVEQFFSLKEEVEPKKKITIPALH